MCMYICWLHGLFVCFLPSLASQCMSVHRDLCLSQSADGSTIMVGPGRLYRMLSHHFPSVWLMYAAYNASLPDVGDDLTAVCLISTRGKPLLYISWWYMLKTWHWSITLLVSYHNTILYCNEDSWVYKCSSRTRLIETSLSSFFRWVYSTCNR